MKPAEEIDGLVRRGIAFPGEEDIPPFTLAAEEIAVGDEELGEARAADDEVIILGKVGAAGS